MAQRAAPLGPERAKPGMPGLFDRVYDLMSVVARAPDELSDEEVRGISKLLPSDVAHTMYGFMNPRVRTAGLAFLKMCAIWMKNAKDAKATGKKVIFVPFNFVPELVHAFENAVPLTSEVLSTLGGNAIQGKGNNYWDDAMGIGIPDHLCSSSTIELGSMLAGGDMVADAIISSTPGACDANSKIHEFAANYLGVPQIILEKPVDDDERGRELYRKNFYRMVSKLEEFVGEEISEERLRDVVVNCNRAAELNYELWEMKKNRPCPVPNLFSFFAYATRFTMWGRPEAVRTLEIMVREAKKRLDAGAYPAPEELARCGWLYVGYYTDFGGLFNWMEERGYTYLFDVLDLFFPEPIPTGSKEEMLDGICEAARTFPMTRQMGANSMSIAWIEDAIQVSRDMGANCAIFCGHHACKQTWSVISIVQKELMERAGAAVLNLQGDAWLSRMTPISTIQNDIDEFVRNVVVKDGKKRKPGRSTARKKSGGEAP